MVSRTQTTRLGMNKKISVIIPTFNRSLLLRRTLLALCEQVGIEKIQEVLVVSDGCTDDTAQAVAEFSDRLPLRLISQPKSGVSIARNRGVQQARGDFVLLLDDDVVPGPHLVAEHMAFHLEFPESESVLLGYVTWLPERRITSFMRWYGEYGGLFGYALLKDETVVDWNFLYTCNVSFKTGFFLANGGLNERLTVFEDHELGFRMSRRGMRLFFRRRAVGYHNQSFTFKQACLRLEKYSVGFDAFKATEAGQLMLGGRSKWKIFLARILQRPAAQPGRLLQRIIDSDFRFPKFVYRAAYWYFATLPASRSWEND